MQIISIIGLDTLGLSLGLALKQWVASGAERDSGRREIRVVGFDYDLSRQKAAERSGAVDATHWSLAKAVDGASLVVVALPATETRKALEELGPLLRDGTVVTDTAPHKLRGLEWASQYLPEGIRFVAGHPMLPAASGELPSADRLRGVTYALFPHPGADESSVQLVVGIVQAVGATPYFADPAEYDAQTAVTNVLPAVAAAALIHTASYGSASRDLDRMAGGDLAEMSSLALLEPALLADMVEMSPAETVRWLDSYIGRLSEIRGFVARADREGEEQLRRFFRDAHEARLRWSSPEHEVKPEVDPGQRFASHLNRMFLGSRRRKSDR